MFDGVFVNQHPFFALAVLKSSEPITAAAEVVQVFRWQIARELIVTREPSIRWEQHERCHRAFEVPIFFQRPAKGGKRLVHRVRWDAADGATEHVALHETCN